MNGTLILKLPVIPHAQQSARFVSVGGKIRSYQSLASSSFKASIKALAAEQLQGRVPFDRNICLRVDYIDYVFPPLKGFTKKKLKLLADGGVIYKNTKPDLSDNLNKGLFDALTGLVWVDDAQVVEIGRTRKIYGNQPGIYMSVTDIEEMPMALTFENINKMLEIKKYWKE